jgi:group I intron endonuclease
MLKTCGIYLIKCTRPDGLPLYYVGQAINIRDRWNEHKRDLRSGSHRNRHMQNVWRKYGESAFSLVVLDACAADDLDESEQWWLDEMHGYLRCMNIAKDVANPQRGIPISAENKAKIGAANRGKKRTDDMRQRLSAATQGRVYGAEVYQKIGAALRGKKRPEHVCEKISAAHKLKGTKPSIEAIQKSLESRRSSMRSPEILATLRKNAMDKARPVIAICMKTGEVKRYESIAATSLDGFTPQNVWQLLNVRGRTHRGHMFQYADATSASA